MDCHPINYYKLSETDIDIARSGAKKHLTQFNYFLAKSKKSQNNSGRSRKQMNAVKHLLVGWANKSKYSGHEEIAEIYRATHKQMIIPPKGENFRVCACDERWT